MHLRDRCRHTNLGLVTQTARAQKQEARKRRVIEAAMRLAADGGYDAVQMREVAARADVALGTIYRYFSSKDAVLVAGMAGWLRLARKNIAAEGIVADQPADQLLAVLDSTVRNSLNEPRLTEALITALASTEPDVAVYKLDVEHELSGLISDALGGFEGVDVDGVRRVIGHVWFSAIVGWVSGTRPGESVMDELELAAHLLLD